MNPVLFRKINQNSVRYLLSLYLSLFSGTEALPPPWNECDGVHQSNPDPQNQSWTRLCTEGSDQRTGNPLSVYYNYNYGLSLLAVLNHDLFNIRQKHHLLQV